MARLDELDMRILSALHSDASVSVPRLGRRLGVNPSSLYTRIKRLQRRGVLGRYNAEVNEAALGLPAVAVAALSIDPKLRESVLQDVGRVEGARLVREVTGRFDVMVDLRARSPDELYRVIAKDIGMLPGVLHAELFVEISKTTPPFAYSLGPESKEAGRERLEAAPKVPRQDGG